MAKEPKEPKATAAATEGSLTEDLARLEAIVRRLESEEGDLDQSLALFEEGIIRLRSARERLGAAEARVRKVLEEAGGTLRIADLDDDGAENG
jgi:exodeoxyribonuclease VII small subunit